jgi:hypothetical protein
MSEQEERSTHFQGFALLLARDLWRAGYLDFPHTQSSEDSSLPLLQMIAEHAYDLVQHTIGYSLEYLHECGHELSGGMGKRIQPTIPDMTAWPEENKL